MPNSLAQERSPYLLQHAENPVEWMPWGEAAFAKARADDKPIFLSIGYSTCHWCHVMAHESFEDGEIANLLNRDFIPVKVDREERPDVDRMYMTFVQATTGAGGWPMSVWLTPDLKPFYGGTYFPPTSRWGRPGFAEILQEVARAWKTERNKVAGSADALLGRLRQARDTGSESSPEDGPIAETGSLTSGVAQYWQTFDRRHGGFGAAPKFPRPVELLFLLREHARTGDDRARTMVLDTLRAMALGGMRDHIGGGFHRYSVDAEWRVPHFEKMLYDQAQLVVAFLEAAQVSSDPFYAAVAEDTLDYVLREMTDPAGGFYSAEDADSVPPEHAGDSGAHKSEGAFYIWSDAELATLLGKDADTFRARFGILPTGNAPHDPQAEFTGKNLLYTARSIEEVARVAGRTVDDVMSGLARARQILFAERASRPRPHLDDKILTAWNGLMIGAFARAARTLPSAERRKTYLDAATRAASFIHGALWRDGNSLLLRRFRGGDAAIEGYCEDYAFFINGLLELFQADGDAAWLDWAIRLQSRQNELFEDLIEGGWFSTTGRDPSVLLRLKEDYDGAEPGATSVSLMNLLALGHWTGDKTYMQAFERAIRRFGPNLGRAARVIPLTLAALSSYHAGIAQIVIVGPEGRQDTDELQSVLAQHYLPFAVTLPIAPGDRHAQLSRRLPFVAAMEMREGQATAYICRDFTCREPVTSASGLRRLLGEAPTERSR